MWRTSISIVSFTLIIIGCSEVTEYVNPEENVKKLTSQEPPYCGLRLADGATGRYLDRVRDSLDRASDSRPSDVTLFHQTVRYHANGISHDANRDTLDQYVGPHLSAKDWVEIVRRLESGLLKSGGYRGCMISDGKIWFQASEAGELELSSVNLDSSWS